MKLKIILAASVICQATPATAGYMTGNDLLRNCRSRGSLELGECLGYIEGAVSIQDLTRDAVKSSHCIPEGTEIGQIKDAVIGFLEKHPADRNMDAGPLVLGAISENWVCKQ